MAWVRARLYILQKGCTRLAAASDKVYQLLADGRWFSPGTPASSTTKAGRHDIAEMLLKVALKHKKSKIISIELEIKDTTDTDRSASYLDIHLDIDSEGRLNGDSTIKQYDFNFPTVNFPFICSNISAAPAYGLYISQLISKLVVPIRIS